MEMHSGIASLSFDFLLFILAEQIHWRIGRQFFGAGLGPSNDIGNLPNTINKGFRVFSEFSQHNAGITHKTPKAIEIGHLFVEFGLYLLQARQQSLPMILFEKVRCGNGVPQFVDERLDLFEIALGEFVGKDVSESCLIFVAELRGF